MISTTDRQATIKAKRLYIRTWQIRIPAMATRGFCFSTDPKNTVDLAARPTAPAASAGRHARRWIRAESARAVGGEYKCWRRYTGLAFSPDSAHVLLAREGSLYTAPIDGVDAERPKLVVKKTSGAGAWIP